LTWFKNSNKAHSLFTEVIMTALLMYQPVPD